MKFSNELTIAFSLRKKKKNTNLTFCLRLIAHIPMQQRPVNKYLLPVSEQWWKAWSVCFSSIKEGKERLKYFHVPIWTFKSVPSIACSIDIDKKVYGMSYKTHFSSCWRRCEYILYPIGCFRLMHIVMIKNSFGEW